MPASPYQALNMYRGFLVWFLFFFFFCGCKWSYFHSSLILSHTFHVLLKGMLVVSPSVRFPALLLCPTCPLAAVCLAVPFPRVGPLAFYLSTPKHFCQEKFEEARPPGSLEFCFLPTLRPAPFLLDFPGVFMGTWLEVSGYPYSKLPLRLVKDLLFWPGPPGHSFLPTSRGLHD